MKINFDNIISIQQKDRPIKKKNPLKVHIQAPEYDEFVRELSGEDISTQILTINQLGGWPEDMSKFLQKQIKKQLKQSSSSSSIKNQSPIYFMERTCSYNEIIKKINEKEQPQNKSNMNKKQKNKNKFSTKIDKVFNYKKHKFKEQDQISSQARKTLADIKQLTYKPKLMYSCMNKKLTDDKKIKTQNVYIEQQNCTIFDTLYNEAKQRKIKDLMKIIQKQQEQVIQKPKINKNYFKNNKSTYTSIYNRLDSIMQTREIKRKQQQKYDLTQMRELFKPDIHLSQQSYKLLSKSIAKQNQHKLKIVKQTQKQKRQKQKIQKQKIQKQKQIQQKIKKIDKKQMQLLLYKNLFASRTQLPKQNLLDTKTIQHFTDIFYSHSSKNIKPISNPLTKQQFLILQNFLRYIDELEQRNYQTKTTITKMTSTSQCKNNILSKQEFQEKFTKFYEKLSLYDRQILRRETLKQNKSKHEKKQPRNNLHKPKINARSSSLDNIAEGHSKHIYYV